MKMGGMKVSWNVPLFEANCTWQRLGHGVISEKATSNIAGLEVKAERQDFTDQTLNSVVFSQTSDPRKSTSSP